MPALYLGTMKFRTELKVVPSKATINLSSGVLTQGSCFSNAIGERMAASKIRVLVNPFGVIYNPESIHQALSYGIYNEPLPDHTFLYNQGLCLNYNLHSEFSAVSKDALVSKTTNTIGATHYFLKDCEWLLITYGTAWGYHRKDTGEIVANCHKLPSASFTKSLMTLESITASFHTFYERLKKFNPKVRVILTVSPVRHIKDTLELNSVSKALLRVACHQLSEAFDDVEYFPAFEIMMDDLRDYRFYKSDLLHPTTDAEDYIWEKFTERYFSSQLQDFIQRWGVIQSALSHKPFHPSSSAHQEFLKNVLKKLEEISSEVDVQAEIADVKRQIENTTE